MVHLLASTGVAATIIAAALLTSASVKQQVAVASIQNYSNVNVSNIECTVANIGVFESTYTPECSNFPGTNLQVRQLNFGRFSLLRIPMEPLAMAECPMISNW